MGSLGMKILLPWLGMFFWSVELPAHGGKPHLQTPWWQAWNWDPLILFNLLLLLLLYTAGQYRLRKRSRLRWLSGAHIYCFYFAILVLFLALISPIDPMSDLLGSVHMLQHTLLMMVAAPLLVVSAPGHVALWALPPRLWKKQGFLRLLLKWFYSLSRFHQPLAIWVFYSFTLWIWHLPRLYEMALRVPWVHDLQHIAFFVAAFLFWSALLDPFSRKNLNPAAGIAYLFVASIHSMILGVLMALAPSVWYESYKTTAPLFGLTGLEDQQLAGLIMWMPAGIAYVVVMLILFLQLLNGPFGAARKVRSSLQPDS